MLAVERRNLIVDLITQNKSVLVVDLAKQFDVTGETIRGDLEKLEKQGVLVRTYGGATVVSDSEPEMSIEIRETINVSGKSLIGKYAAATVREGETIFLDASTSTYHVALNLKHGQNITVITNSHKIISVLSNVEGIKVVSTGGVLRPRSMSYVGQHISETITKLYYANKFFFSCRGVSINRGIFDSNEQEAEIKRAMLASSEKKILLCDKSKLGRIGYPFLFDFFDIDTFITDERLDDQWKSKLSEFDINSIYVEE